MFKFLFILLLLQQSIICAQDSLVLNTKYSYDKVDFTEGKWINKAIAPSIFFVASAASWSERENIREIRNRYIPTFKVGYDDYLQYSPAAAVFGLKIAGVKGRNNTLRATISYASSLAIMGIIVNTVKNSVDVERPDGSANNSFPSGHTSMAFTNATFLHKEYGLVNPLYSIGGYSAATFTGLGRNLNNRHWISDVLAGAGIGILSTELGYFFINKFYKNNGDNEGLLSKISGNDNPSFLALKVGSALGTTNFLKESELDDKNEVGFEAGLEGAYFINKKWGIGADITFSSFPVLKTHFDLDDQGLEHVDIVTQSLGFLNFGIGPYYAYDFNDNFQLMLKAKLGYSIGASGKILLKDDFIDSPTNEFEIAEYKPTDSFRFNSGVSLTYKINNELGITLYSDYNASSSTINYKFNEILADDEMDDNLNASAKEKMNYVGIGLKLTAYF